MSEIIKMQNVVKEFKVLNRREGLKGSIKDLFSRLRALLTPMV